MNFKKYYFLFLIFFGLLILVNGMILWSQTGEVMPEKFKPEQDRDIYFAFFMVVIGPLLSIYAFFEYNNHKED